jgi:hypothetical protein
VVGRYDGDDAFGTRCIFGQTVENVFVDLIGSICLAGAGETSDDYQLYKLVSGVVSRQFGFLQAWQEVFEQKSIISKRSGEIYWGLVLALNL